MELTSRNGKVAAEPYHYSEPEEVEAGMRSDVKRTRETVDPTSRTSSRSARQTPLLVIGVKSRFV